MIIAWPSSLEKLSTYNFDIYEKQWTLNCLPSIIKNGHLVIIIHEKLWISICYHSLKIMGIELSSKKNYGHLCTLDWVMCTSGFEWGISEWTHDEHSICWNKTLVLFQQTWFWSLDCLQFSLFFWSVKNFLLVNLTATKLDNKRKPEDQKTRIP